MPNHCRNVLQLLDPEKSISSVVKKYLSDSKDLMFSGEEPKFLDFDKISPVPARIYSALRFGVPKSTLFDWRAEHWGTRHNSYGTKFVEGRMLFSTVWLPPCPAIARLSGLVKEGFRMLYVEHGMEVCGEMVADKAKGVYSDNRMSVKDAPVSFFEEIGKFVKLP